MRKVVFVSFANSKYHSSLDRIDKETIAFNFNQRFFLSEKDLSQEYVAIMRPKLYRRGYGYWMWKPYLIEKILNQINDDDILVYSDSGVIWNGKGLEIYNSYIKEIEKDKLDFMIFNQPFLEKDWTKKDIFNYLKINDMNVCMSLQIWAGCIFIRKTPKSYDLIKKWLLICSEHPNLIRDKISNSSNYLGFEENRHDQSVFSLLIKSSLGIKSNVHQWSEIQTIDEDWNRLKKNPIIAKRVYRNSSKHNFCDKLIKVRNMFIGYYLKYIMKFDFKNNPSW